MSIPIDDNIVLRGDNRFLPIEEEPSGGGHTIIDGSGTSMTQRAGLQFEGATVTDDSSNDRTKVSIDAYTPGDAAETTLNDADYLPFYDTSATAKKKMLLSTARNDVRARIAEAVSNDVIETIGDTALNSYTVGQYFLGNDGYYYAATSAITAGSTVLNSGVSGNCSKTSIAAGMNSLASQINRYYAYDITSLVTDVYTQISNTSVINFFILGGNIRMIDFNIVTSGAISANYVTLPSAYVAAQTTVHGAIATSGGVSGFVQYNASKNLFIRVPSAGTYNGQLVFMAK